MHILTLIFQRPLSHQFHTLCKNLKVQGVIGRPRIASERHHVQSISTLPWTQFLSYDQLAYITYLRIGTAIKLLSRIFKFWKFQNSKFHFASILRIYPLKSYFQKNETYVKWQWLTKEYVNKISSRHFYSSTSAAPITRRRILLSSTV